MTGTRKRKLDAPTHTDKQERKTRRTEAGDDDGPLTLMPNEIIMRIFRRLDSAKDVCALSAAARLFHCLGTDQALWRHMCSRHHGDRLLATTNRHLFDFGKDWIWLYKSKLELQGDSGVGAKQIEGQGALQGEWIDGKLQGCVCGA